MNRDPNRYVMGVDLGQASDFTAIAVGRFPAAREARSVDVVYLERLPLGTSYPDVVEYVESLMARPPLLGGADLVVDATGVGRPVVDLLRERHLKVEAVTITAGSATRRPGRVVGSETRGSFGGSSRVTVSNPENRPRPKTRGDSLRRAGDLRGENHRERERDFRGLAGGGSR